MSTGNDAPSSSESSPPTLKRKRDTDGMLHPPHLKKLEEEEEEKKEETRRHGGQGYPISTLSELHSIRDPIYADVRNSDDVMGTSKELSSKAGQWL